MMIATVIILGQSALAVHRTAEFTAPNDQRVVKHAALLQILNERGRRLIGLLAALRQAFGKLAVMVPVAVIELDKAHTTLGEASRQQAVVCISARLARIRSV